MYARGEGVERDPVEAYGWLSVAGRAGDQTAVMERARLRREMSAEQIKAGEALARQRGAGGR